MTKHTGSDPDPVDGADRSGPVTTVSVTLPGSASLGAFEAGGLSAVSVVLAELRDRGHEVELVAVGGSSAGAIVGMLAAHAIASGRDVPKLLRRAWIDEVDVSLLRCGGARAPLAFDDLRTSLRDFLDDEDEHPCGVHPTPSRAIALHVSLTSLLGFTTATRIGDTDEELLTYADWVEHEIAPCSRPGDLFEGDDGSILDAVLASASHPGAFRARRLTRDVDVLRERVDPVPTGGEVGDAHPFWYTDGGLVESEPVSRIIRAATERVDGDHLHLVIDPRSSGPSGDEAWADPDVDHTWGEGVTRALSILPTQALHDDLRAVSDLNRRRRRLDELVARLGEVEAHGLDLDWLRDEIEDVAGLCGVRVVDVDVISPLLLADGSDDGVTDLLAGDFIGAFGGFLDRSIRRSDYSLGWRCTRAWVERDLGTHGVADDTITAILDALDDREPVEWDPTRTTSEGIDQLDRLGRWQLFLLATQIARVVATEALPGLGTTRRRRGDADRPDDEEDPS